MGHGMLKGLHMGVDRTQEDEQIKSLQTKKQELGLAHKTQDRAGVPVVVSNYDMSWVYTVKGGKSDGHVLPKGVDSDKVNC